MRRHRLQLREGSVVVGSYRIAQGYIVERSLGQFRFHAHDGLRGGGGSFLVPSGELEHGGNVDDVFFRGLP